MQEQKNFELLNTIQSYEQPSSLMLSSPLPLLLPRNEQSRNYRASVQFPSKNNNRKRWRETAPRPIVPLGKVPRMYSFLALN
jgi:hypothetical protein